MSKKKKPDTSIAAYKEAKEMIPAHHQKILSSLDQLGEAIYEEIATHINMDRHQIGRRLSELEANGKVYKPGTKKPTSTGRMAYVYALVKDGVTLPAKKEVKYTKKEKSAHEHAVDLIKSTQKKQTISSHSLF